MTRVGKIARLPRKIREALNRRLHDGEPGKGLVAWLNSLPKVQGLLAKEFGGRAISEQNLSEWKQGGYKDWLRQEESAERVRRLTEHAESLGEAANSGEVSDRLARVLAAEMAALTEKLLEETTDPKERWQKLREVLQELAQLRKEDHRAARLLMDRERWDREAKDAEEEKAKQKKQSAKDKFCAPYWAILKRGTLARVFGGGRNGLEIAAAILEKQHDLPWGMLRPRGEVVDEPDPIQPGQAESNQIKADQTDLSSEESG